VLVLFQSLMVKVMGFRQTGGDALMIVHVALLLGSVFSLISQSLQRDFAGSVRSINKIQNGIPCDSRRRLSQCIKSTITSPSKTIRRSITFCITSSFDGVDVGESWDLVNCAPCFTQARGLLGEAKYSQRGKWGLRCCKPNVRTVSNGEHRQLSMLVVKYFDVEYLLGQNFNWVSWMLAHK
jgi:hypothetical protein